MKLLRSQCWSGGSNTRAIAGQPVVAAALKRTGSAGQGRGVIEEFVLIHTNGRTGHSVDRRRISPKVTVSHGDNATDAGVHRITPNIPGEERVRHRARSIGTIQNAIGVAVNAYVGSIDEQR